MEWVPVCETAESPGVLIVTIECVSYLFCCFRYRGVGFAGVLVAFCNRYRGFDVRLCFLFSLTPVRGGGLVLLRFDVLL